MVYSLTVFFLMLSVNFDHCLHTEIFQFIFLTQENGDGFWIWKIQIVCAHFLLIVIKVYKVLVIFLGYYKENTR